MTRKKLFNGDYGNRVDSYHTIISSAEIYESNEDIPKMLFATIALDSSISPLGAKEVVLHVTSFVNMDKLSVDLKNKIREELQLNKKENVAEEDDG